MSGIDRRIRDAHAARAERRVERAEIDLVALDDRPEERDALAPTRRSACASSARDDLRRALGARLERRRVADAAHPLPELRLHLHADDVVRRERMRVRHRRARVLTRRCVRRCRSEPRSSDDDFFELSAPRDVRVDAARGVDDLDVEVGVELADEGRVRVREHDVDAALRELGEHLRELSLLRLAEAARDVRREVGGRRERNVRRVEVDKVALFARARARTSKSPCVDRDAAKAREQARRFVDIAEERVRETTERYVELPRAVDAVEAVVARLVQEDRPRGALWRAGGLPA